ncbi:MAG: pyridoxine 5'-phosphate synthase [Rickettsiales bacterium TMED289]|nr:pyridoxine 5'-phosphate synthase [Gammaproteobacteria bacterium]RPF74478.1 MAG: pyridoxine 5'-phosphate synthase [Rickettsiales bacterium TMED289]|tara:strand:- start:121 stop:864 length:744 start_codon:yes stop_codon:yes gene_type:complete
MKLSINLNKIALLRNSRGGHQPDLEYFAKKALDEDIIGLTAHPRPDERHMKHSDLELIKNITDQYTKEFNIEGNPLEGESKQYIGFMEIVRKYKPTQTTLVPDSTSQITSDHGWEITKVNSLNLTNDVRSNSARCSIFVDADSDLDLLTNKDINAIEIYTGPYAQAVLEDDSHQTELEVEKIKNLSYKAKELGLRVNAGHDLNLKNLPELRKLDLIDEVSIGHAIITESLIDGFNNTIKKYLEVTNG